MRREGVELVGPCPVCGGTDRFAVNTRKRVWHCRGCGKGGDAVDLLRHVTAWPLPKANDFHTAFAALIGTSVATPGAPARPSDPVAPSREALRLWREGMDPTATPVATYLSRRGVALPRGAAVEVIRYHPACRFGTAQTACMLALVRSITTDEPQALHRTALSPAGEKITVDGHDRMALGPIAGGAVKITDDAEVTQCLAIGEGIETTLSLQRIPEFGASPVWSLLSAGGIEKFPVLAGIECLWIAVDRDPAGERAAAACRARWIAAGQEVFLIRPGGEGEDINDLIGRE